MKYIEIFQRLQIQFPDVAEGFIKSLFNQYSKIFQRETYCSTLVSLLVKHTDFVARQYSNTDVIMLESVSENNVPFSLIYLDTPDLSNSRVKVGNTKFYFIIDNVIYLCVSDSNGYLSFYTPTEDIVLSGRFVNPLQLITDDTLANSEFDDTLALAVLYALYSELYKITTKQLDLAEYYKKEFKEAIRQFRKYGLSANRPATLRSNW